MRTRPDSSNRPRGRDIRRIYHIPGAFAPTAPAPASDTDQTIVGPPDHWVEALTHLALDIGFDTFMLAAEPDPDTLRTFAEEVAPAVSERVTAARA
jgi:alkanesulfonate monooxygenase SsuD/methylene tetrahydromethanopterin reductase-like flavin-dependent oxidoreductase (luciferase family)